MNLRTYELIAHYIGKEHGITVKLEPDARPTVDMDKKLIIMPSNIDPNNAYAALASLMHEAAHIGHTRIPKSAFKDGFTEAIINAMEDARVDDINFGRLPNVHEFYDRLYKAIDNERKGADLSKAQLLLKEMSNAVMRREGFRQYSIKDKETLDFEEKSLDETDSLFKQGISAIQNKDWNKLHEITEAMIKLLNLADVPRPPAQGQGEGKGQGGKKGQGQAAGGGPSMKMPGEMKEIDNKEDIFGKGQSHGDGTMTTDLGEKYLREATKERFRALLCQKETRFVDDGNQLKTDNLSSFFLGDIEDLFRDELIQKRRKSKIQFLMDGSGSMGCTLPYSKKCNRKKVVSGCIRDLVNVLDEIRSVEGYDVDYDVSVFDDEYHRCSKENWEKVYSSIGGGTNLESAFKKAHKDLLEDKTIDGTKILILMTDGEVSGSEIRCMKEELMSKNEDVRFLIVGIGSDMQSDFVKEIVGEHNIIAEETADLTVLGTVMDCLE